MLNKITNNIPDYLLDSRFKIHRHLALQIVVILITMNLFWDIPDTFIATKDRFLMWIGYYAVTNIMIYINAYVLVPQFLLKNKFFLYILFLLLVIFLSLSVIMIGLNNEPSTVTHETTNNENMPIHTIIISSISSIIGIGLLISGISGLQLFRHWISHSEHISKLESANLETELQFLKNQINPHFLFNMLNNANMLIRKNPDEASQVLLKLEDLLRYQIDDSSKEKVLLSADIHFLNDFLNLEKVRRDNFDFIISKEGAINQVWIPPLLFIPFVENAVKHNFDSENGSYVHLYFKVWNDKLDFRCENSKPSTALPKRDVGGLGLKNIKRRLELLYPDRHVLEIIDEKNKFIINLQLDL